MITEVILIILMFFYYWQLEVVFKCRQYFYDKKEQSAYMELAIPESFIDTKITEKLPIQPKKPKVSDISIYSLDEIPLESPTKNQDKSDK